WSAALAENQRARRASGEGSRLRAAYESGNLPDLHGAVVVRHSESVTCVRECESTGARRDLAEHFPVGERHDLDNEGVMIALPLERDALARTRDDDTLE